MRGDGRGYLGIMSFKTGEVNGLVGIFRDTKLSPHIPINTLEVNKAGRVSDPSSMHVAVFTARRGCTRWPAAVDP